LSKLQAIFIFIFFWCFHVDIHSQTKTEKLYLDSKEFFNKGNYAEALNCNIKALKLAENDNSNKSILAYANIQVAKMYYYLSEKRLALNYFFVAKTLVEKHQIDSLKTNLLSNIGVIYTELGKTDTALVYLNESKIGMYNIQDYTGLSRLCAVIADLHLNHTRNFELAKKNIIEAEAYANKANDESLIAFANIKYSIYYRQIKQYPLAVEYAKKALNVYQKNGRTDGIMYGLKVLAESMALNGNSETKDTYTRYLNLKDSVFKEETANKIADYKTKYETEKKETENRLLQQDNLLKQSKIDERNKTIIVLVIGILLIVFIVIWRINIINLKKKQKELEATQAIQKEKERISRDLHDNVGGQLSYVLYSLDGINTDDKSKRIEITSNVNESVRNVISNLRETIWAINDEAININDFSDKLKVYVRSMFRNTETKISFTENIQIDTQLNSLVGLNLYRICQEIINNAFKHSKATELLVNITSDKHVVIEIKDNGVGFDLESVEKDGFGLANIKSRAAEVGINLELESKLNNGVSYKLLV
jgi:signal transduction histidine kinase